MSELQLIALLSFGGPTFAFIAGAAVVWWVRERRRSTLWEALHDEYALCDATVERDEDGYLCTACGFATAAERDEEALRLLSLAQDLWSQPRARTPRPRVWSPPIDFSTPPRPSPGRGTTTLGRSPNGPMPRPWMP